MLEQSISNENSLFAAVTEHDKNIINIESASRNIRKIDRNHYYLYICSGMKYLAIIFSVYMTMLSLLPCQDSDDVIASVMHATVQKSNSCNKQGSQETCPPFCTCSCCSTARYVNSNTVITVFVKAIIKVYPDYRIPAIQKQPIKIWQPPRLA